MRILVLNGPNLNMLGTREPAIYGSLTLEQLVAQVGDYARKQGIEVEALQSNSEGALIDAIHAAPDRYAGVVFNPGAYTHYSYALRDAIACIDIPVVEVHLSDIAAREDFRKHSVTAEVCVAQHSGGGAESYLAGIDAVRDAVAGTEAGTDTKGQS